MQDTRHDSKLDTFATNATRRDPSIQLPALVLALALASALAGQLAACSIDKNLTITDSMQFELFTADLHSPYVLGTTTTITVDRHEGSVDGWSIEASDPNVLTLSSLQYSGDHHYFSVQCQAVGQGTTDLLVRDSAGRVRLTKTVEVAAPDRITLVPAGLRLVLGPDNPDVPSFDPGDTIRIVADGQATFRVQYWAQGKRLYGNDTLTLETSDSMLRGEPEQTYLLAKGEWLQLTGDATGTYELKLGGGEAPSLAFPVEVVPQESVDQVLIESQDTDHLKNDDNFYLLARAFDSEGHELFGASFEWDLEGEPIEGEGDLLLATYAEDHHTTVTVHSGDAQDAIDVEMSGGTVTSSNEIGCSTAPVSGQLPLFMALAGMALLSRRRRRRA